MSQYVAQGKEDSPNLNELERMLEKGSWSHKPEDLFSPYDSEPCKEQNRLTSDNTRMSDHCFKSNNLDSSSSELCADDSILGDKCAVEDDSVSQYSINHISQTDNELSFLDNDGWLNIGNFEDVDRMMLSCDLTFGMESLNNEEFCWLSSSHGTQGSDNALKSEFKLSSAEASPLKSIPDNNIETNENIEGLSINDSNNKASPIDNKVRSQMDVDHVVPSSLSTFSESEMELRNADDLMPKQKMQGKQSKLSAGKRKNGYLQNGDSDHPYAHVEQYANLKQPFGASSSGVTSQDSIHKHRPNMDCDSLGHIQIQTQLMHTDYSHTSDYATVLPTLSGSRSEHGGHLSPPFKESTYATNMESSHVHPFEVTALQTNDEGENLYICHETQLLSGGFKSENMENTVPFKNPGSVQKVGHKFENDNEGHSEVGGVSIGFSQEIDSSNVQETSSMSSALDETSHEATSFRQLQQVMDQLDIRTKLCIRDSLYRLAKSAEQRHNDANASGQVGENIEGCKAIMTHDANRCTGFMNMETNTNPIDRSIAHLLFHRPSDSSTLPLSDPSLPFKSSSMIHGSVINPPVVTEKKIYQEESSAGVEKKSSGVTPHEK